MAGIKSLAKDTAIYGLSSIVGRFLNWCLVPLYVYIFPTEEYGIVSYLYSFTAVALVILNYGMETGFFRFANKESDPEKVYTTSLLSVGFTSLMAATLVLIFLNPITSAIRLEGKESLVGMLAIIIAIDAFSNIPFAYLRYKNRPIRFATIKMTNVALNIGLNLFFILFCPNIPQDYSWTIDWFYQSLGGESFGIGWIFVANLISSTVVLLMLFPQIRGRKFRFSSPLLRQMLSYSWPLLILGIAGMLSQNMGQMMIPFLFTDTEAARSMVGIYGANIKIAIVMVMFTQAFRYAYEPFIFSQAKTQGNDKNKAYCDAMKYFIIFGLLIFLFVQYFLPILKYFVSEDYWSGLQIVPIMMLAELFFGIFFNLSLWYKLTDKTQWGMYFSLIGFALMFTLNLLLVPAIGIPNGYVGSAWAATISYFVIMVLSYFVGRRYYPLPYELKRIGSYFLLGAILWGIGEFAIDFPEHLWLTYSLRLTLLALYIFIVSINEEVPIVSKITKKLVGKIKK